MPARDLRAFSVHRGHLASELLSAFSRPLLVVFADEIEAKRLAGDIAVLSGRSVRTLFGREFVFHNAEGVSRQLENARIRTLRVLLDGDSPVTVATVDGLMQRTLPPELFSAAALSLKLGGEYDLEAIAKALARMGYSRTQQVEGPASSPFAAASWTFSPPPTTSRCGVSFSGTRSTP
jgi:transcription-repair coupling factor (superfamily II helicase)